MSLKQKSLRTQPFMGTMPAVPTLAARVRQRLREELDERNISQRACVELLNKRKDDEDEAWTQSKLGKILTGRVELRVDDVAAIADVVDLHFSELVRDRGLEFYAEMTPTELRIIERIRQRPDIALGLLQILDVKVRPTTKK